MLSVFVNNIVPVFSLILLGYLLTRRAFIGPSFIQPANRLVFYVAVPAMLFHKVARSSFSQNFDPQAVLSILGALAIHFAVSLAAAHPLALTSPSRKTFLHSSFHGNLGYMAYAIAYYALGERAFAQTALLSSFLIVAQNLLAIGVYAFQPLKQAGSTGAPPLQRKNLVRQMATNPIILSVLAGVVCSFLRIPLHGALSRSLEILSGMALPMALLLIGASLSFRTARKWMGAVLGIGLLKLLALPLVGLVLMGWMDVSAEFRLPALILLAAPPATVTYIMSCEGGGDPELAATAISVLTLLSGLTYACFLTMGW
ncbi:hypothetical protein SAMN02746041_02135 [Desulfacinum hydrothermale DSM 13146]|uniref:AEC family transporter n=1 Tax=Desulfacinum hydrothermale DSM 13146 TaxID=1121390 RepID=A0A1W1XLS2_9BACT|nr:AEC family transporter [Desulfacinum hydrothermale]SMC24893.1 hypothetical protein SAMN02746041_02135 [Desulfacinum hydrothermale DSM 13146]